MPPNVFQVLERFQAKEGVALRLQAVPREDEVLPSSAGREELAAAHRDVQGAAPFNNSLRRYRRMDERDRR